RARCISTRRWARSGRGCGPTCWSWTGIRWTRSRTHATSGSSSPTAAAIRLGRSGRVSALLLPEGPAHPNGSTMRYTLDLMMQHPHTTPTTGARMGPYLICGPSAFSSTARWLAFRDETLDPMIACHPDDPFLKDYRRQVEAVLAWRDAIPPEQRFWKAD